MSGGLSFTLAKFGHRTFQIGFLQCGEPLNMIRPNVTTPEAQPKRNRHVPLPDAMEP
jgi:hypothetical protein